MTKSILAGLVALVVVVSIYGGYLYPVALIPTGAVSLTTSANTSKVAEAGFAPSVPGATTTSMLNTDTQDRIIITSEIFCSSVGTSQTAYTGTGLANLTFSIATTSTSAPVALGNTNYILNNNMTTSTVETYVSSSTPYAVDYRRWAVGSYITISANATNTAQCIWDVKYLQGLGV